MKIDWLERLKTKKTKHAPVTATAAPVPKPSKPLREPDACYNCPDSWARCHTCPHGCKIPLVIGKQYPAEHVYH